MRNRLRQSVFGESEDVTAEKSRPKAFADVLAKHESTKSVG